VSEEIKQEPQAEVPKTEETVAVSEKDMESINAEIDKTDATKVEEAKKEGAQAVADKTEKSLAEIKAELEAVRLQNAKAAEEAEKARVLKELEEEKAKAESATSVQKKHLVAQDSNPIAPTNQEQAPVSSEQEWAQFDRDARSGNFSAVYKGD